MRRSWGSRDLHSSLLKLLVPDDATIDHWDLRGRVKDAYGKPGPGGRVIRLAGELRRSEVRVYRGGIAIVNAMLSNEYLADARAAWKEGRLPIVDDPARDPYDPAHVRPSKAPV